jgi:hypothetical protein
MIPTKVDAQTFAQMCNRVLAVFDSATPDQKARGENWYRTAYDLARMIGDGNPRVGAGVIAALSANKSWAENTRLAIDAQRGNVHGHTGANLAKASAILNGARPEDVLPMHAKTGNFYLCIFDPTHPTAVCIDRHAHDIAVGERYGNRNRGLGCANRYNTLADVYRSVAYALGMAPATVQAVTWVTWLDSRGNV